MKKMIVLVGLLAQATAFASGSPVMYCDSEQAGLSLTLYMSQNDEDIWDVMGKANENDEYSTIAGDYDPDYPSFFVRKKVAQGEGEELAAVSLPKNDDKGWTSGIYTSSYLTKKRALKTIMVNSTTYNEKPIFSFRILANNKGHLEKDTMTGLMTLQISKSAKGTVKQEIDVKQVPVTCNYGWE
jgi:hypothetical protein